MKLEQQVVSLELAQKLKSLGVKQESAFYWHGGLQFPYLVQRKNGSDTISAFTVAELGELLPVNVQLPFKKEGLAQEYWYWSSEKGRHRENTEADARAKCLVYLLENNLIIE